jgi:cobalt transporter subunit CbtB
MKNMTQVTAIQATAAPHAKVSSDVVAIAFAALMGVGLLFVGGFVQASALHDVAHDQRHAIAFPCH